MRDECRTIATSAGQTSVKLDKTIRPRIYLGRNRLAPNIAPDTHIGRRNCKASTHLTDTSPSIVVGIKRTA